MSDVMPAMSGITDYFDITSLDVENGVWRNILAGNDMTLNGGVVEDEALKLVSGEWGEVETAEPMTIYILLKKPVRETDLCIIAKGLSAKTQKADLGLWSSGDKSVSYTLSIYGSPYVRTVVDDSAYHVVVLAKKSAVDTDSQDGAMLYIDGALKGFLTGTLTGSYAGFVTLNRRYNAGYTSACETDTYVRVIAIGGEQTVEQILENSAYLLENIRPESLDSKMSGSDAAAIAWCMKQNLEQAKSVKQQKKAYKKGLQRGNEGGADIKEDYEQDGGSIDLSTDGDGRISEPFIGSLEEGIYYTDESGAYVYLWLDNSQGASGDTRTSTGAIVYEAHDSSGNLIAKYTSTAGNRYWKSVHQNGSYYYAYKLTINGADVRLYWVECNADDEPISYTSYNVSPTTSEIVSIMGNAVKVGNIPPDIIS